MVVDDLYVRRSLAGPPEADPVSVVYPDALLTFPVARQRFEPISRGYPKLFEAFHRIELIQLALGYKPQAPRAALPGRFRVPAVKYVLRSSVRKGPDHRKESSMTFML